MKKLRSEQTRTHACPSYDHHLRLHVPFPRMINTEATTDAGPAGWAGVTLLVQNSAFMSITIAAALNDVASYALVAWQVRFVLFSLCLCTRVCVYMRACVRVRVCMCV